LQSNTGSNNSAVGFQALQDNTSGNSNTALGDRALTSNTTASNNTAVGYQAGYSNTTGTYNAFLSRLAGYANTTGSYNTMGGSGAGINNTTGGANTVFGADALFSNTTASNNTAIGYQAGYSTTTSSGSVYVGYLSGQNTTSLQNTFVGSGSGYLVTSGQKNTIIGTYSGNQGGLDIRTSSNYIVLSDGDGNPRAFMDTATFYSVGIYNTTTGGGANVNVASNGALLRSTSSLKYKHDVVDATHGLAEVMTLRPVTYKGNNDGDTVFGGLIAEEVHDAGLTEFVQYNDDGEPDALAYGNMVSLCIKAIQDQQATITALEARITALENV